MKFFALATDYDNTLASDGRVADSTWEAVERLRASGRHAILVSGRELDDLLAICPRLDLFSRVVAENGGVLYCPATGARRLLAPAPPENFVAELKRRAPAAYTISETLVATVKPHEHVALDVIRDLGLGLQIIFNGDAVMIVAPGVSKASGLKVALDELELSPLNVVGVGDAENDHALLNACGLGVAVGNALPELKKHADAVMHAEAGAGVAELIGMLLADDLRAVADASPRHRILLGTRRDACDRRRQREQREQKQHEQEQAHEQAQEQEHEHAHEQAWLPLQGSVALLVGPSGCGKSTATAGVLERLASAGCHLCVIDPEGDYVNDDTTIVLGDAQSSPSIEEAVQLLTRPGRPIVAVNLLRVPQADRPVFCANLLLHVQRLRTRTGRPHWLVFDEAHHLFPAAWEGASQAIPEALETALAVTVSPEQLASAFLRQVSVVLSMGADAEKALQSFASGSGRPPPPAMTAGASTTDAPLKRGEALLWRVDDAGAPQVVCLEPGHKEKRRHRRKYAEGLLIPERSFYFRGEHGKLNLRAHNLVLFIELAEGVDADTWQFHRRRGDYSRWFEEQIGDDDLASEARAIEQDDALDAAESLTRIRAAIQARYTQPENPSLPAVLAGTPQTSDASDPGPESQPAER